MQVFQIANTTFAVCRGSAGGASGWLGGRWFPPSARDRDAAPAKIAGFQTGSGQAGFSQKGRTSNPLHFAVFCFKCAYVATFCHILSHFVTFWWILLYLAKSCHILPHAPMKGDSGESRHFCMIMILLLIMMPSVRPRLGSGFENVVVVIIIISFVIFATIIIIIIIICIITLLLLLLFIIFATIILLLFIL